MKNRFCRALVLALALLLALTACTGGADNPPQDVPLVKAADGGTVLCVSPSLALVPADIERISGALPASLRFTSTTSVAVNCLLDGTGDSLFTLAPTADFYAARTDHLSSRTLEQTANLCMLVSVERPDLAVKLSAAIMKFRADGTIDALYEKWVTAYTETGRPENAEDAPSLPVIEFGADGEVAGTIRVGFSGTLPLIDYALTESESGGFTTAFLAALSEELQMNILLVSVLPESKIPALLDDKIDVYLWHFLDVPDVCIATEPYLTVPYAFLDADLSAGAENSK